MKNPNKVSTPSSGLKDALSHSELRLGLKFVLSISEKLHDLNWVTCPRVSFHCLLVHSHEGVDLKHLCNSRGHSWLPPGPFLLGEWRVHGHGEGEQGLEEADQGD